MHELSLIPIQNDDFRFDEVYNLCKERNWGLVLSSSAIVNSIGHSILIACILEKDKVLFHELVFNQIGLHIKDNDSNLPLHHAAKIGSLKFVKELCKHNMPDQINKWHQTPIHIAAFEGHAKVLRALAEYTQFLSLEAFWDFGGNKLEVTPLALSVIGGHIPCIDIFLEKETHLSTYRVNFIGTLVHLAIFFHQNHVLEHLLSTHRALFLPQLNEQNSQKQTPLMLAAFLGNLEAIRILNDKEVKLDLTNGEGNTAMHFAVMGNQGNAVTLLIQFEADCRILNQNKKEPLILANDLIPLFGNEMRSIEALLNNTIHLKKSDFNYIDYPPENLVSQGGGPRGGGLIGSIIELEDSGLLTFLKRVAGTSAGSIAMGLLAVGYTGREIEKIHNEINLMDLLDVDAEVNLMTTIQALKALVEAYYNPLARIHLIKSCLQKIWHTTGICKGDLFRNTIEGYIHKKTGKDLFTLKDLREGIQEKKPYKHFYLCATKINGELEILDMNSEDGTFDDVPLSDAIFGSMCIPGLFKPFRLHKRGKNGTRIPTEYVVVDGGLLSNLLAERFDREKYVIKNFTQKDQDRPIFNMRTLALAFQEPQVDPSEKPIYNGPENLKDFLKSMFNVFSGAESLIRKLNPYNESRIIRIDPCGISLKDFNLSQEKKSEQVQAGKVAVRNFKKEQNFRFHKAAQKENISEKSISMQEVGTIPGVYLYNKKWIFCDVTIGKMVHLNEHPQMRTYDLPFLKIAFCECQGSMVITTEEKDDPKNISLEKGKAQVFEILSWNHLKFEIKEK